MYRSFLRCDDPKGVVGCGTIRKYGTCSHKIKDKTKVQKTDEQLMSKRYNKEEMFQKRNDGNGSLIGQSSMYDEDIAQHILKGALDLQDSIIMLHKLQEASQHTTTHFSRNLTEIPKRDAEMIDRMEANPFSQQCNQKGLQRPQPCPGGSCKEELKEVIKESLVRQKRPQKMVTEGLDSASERFSTISSQSSETSFSVIASKVEKGPSLILKLMGLEEPPSRSFPPAIHKHLDGENVNMSKVKKNKSIADHENANPEQEALGSNKSFVKEPKLHVHHFSYFNSNKLKKTQCTQYNESVKTLTPVPPDDLSMRKLKADIVSSKTIKHREGFSSIKMGKESASKRLNKEEGPKFLREVVKVDGKRTNPTEASSGNVKLFWHQPHTNEANDKKWMVQTISGKQLQNGISEPRIVARPQHQQLITPTKVRKPKIMSRINKNGISSLQSSNSNTISFSRTQSLTCRKNQMKNQSTVSQPKPAKLTVEQIRQGEKKRSIHVPDKDDYTEIRIATTIEDELIMVCEADAYVNQIEECKQNKSCSGKDIIKSAQKFDGFPADIEGAELKHFLLSSESFIGHAEKRFNLLDAECSKKEGQCGYGTANTLRLYLDFANELLERKSLQVSQQVPSRLDISLGMLVEEMNSAIENLKLYREDSGEEPFAMTERDMKCNGMISGMWERGWRHGFSAHEVELVVNKMETLIVSGLIEELIVNL